MRSSRLSRSALIAMLGLFLVLAATPAQAGQRPSAGAAEIGDRLFPGLGNGGYDVLHYDLDLRYATSDPAQSVEGTARIVARATQSLSRFNLDFSGDGPGAVGVNGRRAGWSARWRGAGRDPQAPDPQGPRVRRPGLELQLHPHRARPR